MTKVLYKTKPKIAASPNKSPGGYGWDNGWVAFGDRVPRKFTRTKEQKAIYYETRKKRKLAKRKDHEARAANQ